MAGAYFELAPGLQYYYPESEQTVSGFTQIGNGARAAFESRQKNPLSSEKSRMHPRTMNSVREILLPFTGELPLEPSVHLNDQITAAIEIMVKHNLQLIPVIWNTRPVGQVRLTDAFASVGIRIS